MLCVSLALRNSHAPVDVENESPYAPSEIAVQLVSIMRRAASIPSSAKIRAPVAASRSIKSCSPPKTKIVANPIVSVTSASAINSIGEAGGSRSVGGGCGA